MSTLKPRTATIPIYQGDDSERLAELRMAVAVAERQVMLKRQQWEDSQRSAAPRRRGDDTPTAESVEKAETAAQDARNAYDAFVDEAAERAVEVVVRAIGRRRFRELVTAHPPRTEKNDKGEDVTHADDAEYGVDMETFPPALLTFAESGEEGVRTIVKPDEVTKSPGALRDFLDDDVTEGDYERIFTVAYWINRAPGSDPKELRYSPSISVTSE